LGTSESQTVDLFGNTRFVVPRKKGRPPFERTQENANVVSMLLAVGWSNERIAGVIKDPRTGKAISVPTLKRYFRPELQERDRARDALTAARLMQTFGLAQDGNVAAQKYFDAMVDREDRMLLGRRFHEKGEAVPVGDDGDDIPEAEVVDETPGKKAKAAQEAKEVTQNRDAQGDWDGDLTPGQYPQ